MSDDLTLATYRSLTRVPGLSRLVRRVALSFASRRFARDLRRINAVLSETEIAGRYWLWSGLLLGWAREGRILPHDRDADFAIRAVDRDRLYAAVPALRAAGFRPLRQFRNNAGEVTEVTFIRHRTKFEFFSMFPQDGNLRYFVYGWPPDHLVQIESEVPDQELVSFTFLGATWFKARDHERELTALYGDWRTPDPDWYYLDDTVAVSREPWREENSQPLE